MIRQIENFTPEEILFLEKTWRGRQILSYYDAYGAGYDFCRFFRVADRSETGILLLFQATLLICTTGNIAEEELAAFTQMHCPFRVECPDYLWERFGKIPGYCLLHRTTFSMTPSSPSPQFQLESVNPAPKLQDVYAILQEGFPNLKEYSLWLTDTSHRIRHGISQCFTYRDMATLTQLYVRNGFALIGQVATRVAARGQGYAGNFLRWMACQLSEEGITGALYALDMREGFYRTIGFTAIETEYVLERVASHDENAKEKGVLL